MCKEFNRQDFPIYLVPLLVVGSIDEIEKGYWAYGGNY